MQQFTAGVPGNKPFVDFKCYSINYELVSGAFDNQMAAVEE
jgi:hypothetical protein